MLLHFVMNWNHQLLFLIVTMSFLILLYQTLLPKLFDHSVIKNSSLITKATFLISTETENEKGSGNHSVPNVIHYIRLNKRSWSFVEYICLLSAYANQQPDYIFIHTNIIGGFRGKYWKWIQQKIDLNMRLIVLPVEIPSEIFGKKLNPIWKIHHGSDILRIKILMKYGGIYLDNDVYVVQNLDKYRKFEMTLGWPKNESLGSMVLIANKNARFLHLWLENYQDYNASLWYFNAGDNPTHRILLKMPQLVKREETRLGINFMMRELFQSKDYAWKVKLDTIHLLINHRRYLDMFFKDYRYFNEHNILHYPFIFAKMVKYVIESV
ncbi:uncharacterized protein LOC124200288 [Daphnia pulex]|uniref:uncharacterized protein LOC124200288 n=1 Tax=Daphnia pulex TaxID=6669 RepID=UPI001EDD53A0|nr:uncharacterized protein LOC124200288 [Daphnia pulex]